MSKVKEFKGSLIPIFGEDTKNEQNIKLNILVEKEIPRDELAINQIKPRVDQPRKIFNELALAKLTESIKSTGIIQPIIVKPIGNGLYEIIVGERRWRAAKQAGLDTIPVIIREYNKQDGMSASLVENIQRENLNPLEEAQAIQTLLKECAMTHNQVAKNIGKSREAVSNLLRLLTLTHEVKEMINSGLLEMGHARALLSLSGDKQVMVAKIVSSKRLSVRETEKLVKRADIPQVQKEVFLTPDFEEKTVEWRKNFSKLLSSEVNVQFKPNGTGRVVISFDSIEEADWLMQHLRVDS